MADDTLDDLDSGPQKKRISGKRLIIFAAILLLVLVGGGVGAAFMLGLFSSPPPPAAAADGAPAPVAPPASQRSFFFELPDLIVNLNADGRRSTFLKIKVALELEGSQDVNQINDALPRIVDNFQVYLRELRIDDLNGSAGMYRLREELLRRVNIAARPVRVRDVLFKEMLVQ